MAVPRRSSMAGMALAYMSVLATLALCSDDPVAPRTSHPSPSSPPLLLRGLCWCYHRFSRDSFLSYPFPTPPLIPSLFLLPFFRLIHLLFARLFLRSSSILALILVLAVPIY